MKIYFAGPLFTAAERDFNAAVVEHLRLYGHGVFLPQESEQKMLVTARDIFFNDVRGIDWADVVVANMDQPDPDSGTCWECGYAYGKQKPILLYRTDIREEKAPFGPYNLMLHQAANAVINLQWKSVDQIAEAIDAALRTLYEGTQSSPSNKVKSP
jgi:nucleoside 2-deoxyribosyltransferase